MASFVNYGADVGLQDADGVTPLHYAVHSTSDQVSISNAALQSQLEDEGCLTVLMATNPNPNVKDLDGRTALLWAAAQGEHAC